MKLGSVSNKTFVVWAFAAMFAFQAWNALGDYTTGMVSGLTAKQRYPWNGLVDISFTLSGPESRYCVAVTATNAATGAEIPVRTLRDARGNALYSLYSRRFAPGSISFIWDADIDAPGVVVESLALSVVTVPAPLHRMVQLWEGGPYWATTNIGAEKPEDYGLYFWWGDTVGYRREGSAWVASDGSSQNFQFYYDAISQQTYNKTPATLAREGWIVSRYGPYFLVPEHDAAQVQWGGGWRMPTRQELDDLCYNKCDWTWTLRNGVNGYEVRGRGDYSNATIFLPCAGYGFGTSLGAAGGRGDYWSSTSSSDEDYSWSLGFHSGGHFTGGGERSFGYPVRPVQGFTE